MEFFRIFHVGKTPIPKSFQTIPLETEFLEVFRNFSERN
ncbi:hypothetical protein LEP1GSC131_1576 [Leptospira kirschneri str. 200802841]|uniref:Uncharacterized protein n=1 Tax=Leptospira kirschneri str. 200802841 TaxID=1193047 RepID=A0A828Y309_9LEPT|nr:hypothetical protein LEP1GSC131_1576 [Leptospira kirschneri str. 200802841]